MDFRRVHSEFELHGGCEFCDSQTAELKSEKSSIKKINCVHYILSKVMLTCIVLLPYWLATFKRYVPKSSDWIFDPVRVIVKKLVAVASILRVMMVFRAPLGSAREAFGCG